MIQTSDLSGEIPEDIKETESVIQLVAQLEAGCSQAIQAAWSLFQKRLEAFGRKILNRNLCKVFDEGDLASEVFQKFLYAARLGKCSKIRSMSELWRYLATITTNHAKSRHVSETCQKRGGGMIRGESIFLTGGRDEAVGFDRFHSKEGLDTMTEYYGESAKQFINSLPNDTLKKITEMKMAGYENTEIAEEFSISTRSVERKLALIRSSWKLKGNHRA